MGYSPSGTDYSRKPLPAWASLHRLRLLPGACSSVGSSWAAAFLRACPPVVVL